MKRIVCSFTILLVLGSLGLSNATAQDTASAPYGNKRIMVGPEFLAGPCAFIGTIPNGLKTDMRFAFETGILSYINITPSFGFTLGLAYDGRGMNFHDQNNSSELTNTVINYFSIQPGLKFKDFTLGVGIGIPFGGNYASEGVTAPAMASGNLNASDMNTLVELRIGGMVPIVESESGDFRFMINGSYPLTKTFGSTSALALAQRHNPNPQDGPVATLTAGFGYLFGVSK